MSKRLLIILSSIRQGRRGQMVADWFLPIARADDRFDVRLGDLADFDLPLKMENTMPSERKDKKYPAPEVQRWSDLVDSSDGFVIITPEYNHAMPASLKNALDHLYFEWHGKAVGYVGYGARGAGDAIKSLAGTERALKWQVIEPRVAIEQVWSAFGEKDQLIDPETHEKNAKLMLDALAQQQN